MSASIEASLRLEIAQYQQALAKAKADAAKFKDQLKKTGSGLGGALFGQMGSQLSALLPAASVAAAVGGFKSIATSMDDLVDTALRLNETTETIQRVEFASKRLASVDAEGLTRSFLRLERSLGDIENIQAAKAFEDLGISASQLAALPLDQKVLVIAEAFQKARETGTGYKDIMDLLGKSAGDMIPMLTQGKDAIEAMFAEAPVVIDATVQRLAMANDRIDGMIDKVKSWATEAIGAVIGLATMSADEMVAAQEASDRAFMEAADKRMKASAAILEKEKEIKKEAEKKEETVVETKKADESEKIATAQQKLREAQKRSDREQMTDAEKIAAIKKDIAAQQASIAAFSSISGPDGEMLKIEAERKRIELQRELNRLIQQEGEHRKHAIAKAAEAARAAAEKLNNQNSYKKSLEEEMAILQAKASGNNRLAEQMERELRIRAKAKEIQEQAGVSEQQARNAAERMVGYEERAAKRGEDTPDGKGSKPMRRRMMGGVNGPLWGDRGVLSTRAARAADKSDDARAPMTTLEDINKAQLEILKKGLLGG